MMWYKVVTVSLLVVSIFISPIEAHSSMMCEHLFKSREDFQLETINPLSLAELALLQMGIQGHSAEKSSNEKMNQEVSKIYQEFFEDNGIGNEGIALSLRMSRSLMSSELMKVLTYRDIYYDGHLLKQILDLYKVASAEVKDVMDLGNNLKKSNYILNKIYERIDEYRVRAEIYEEVYLDRVELLIQAHPRYRKLNPSEKTKLIIKIMEERTDLHLSIKDIVNSFFISPTEVSDNVRSLFPGTKKP